MLNYENLNDVEFEHLCNDIMSKILCEELRRFAAGRDGGVDLTNDSVTKDIVVQVKHYSKTNISGLISSLKKEVSKVNEINPREYYICCSKELSADRIKEIYQMFSDYMTSDKNIITLMEIEEFLINPQNVDVLHKHYKLWISSTSILQDIFNNDIFIDCEMLLADIEKQVKFFVQTKVYDDALKCLSTNRVLFITGDPGVGKTITSKMLVLYFSAQGYSVRYTTNGADLNQLKKSLSRNKDKQEIILLDDCFGQAYFNMKETQGSELLSLIKYVHLSANKILVLNSRVTIYQEAKVKTPELISSFENKEFRVNIIDVNQMSNCEKAKIYYNHLYFNQVDDEFWASIKDKRKYREIVTHRNYNPRIIEFISNANRFSDSRYHTYIDFVMGSLDNPSQIWNDEYERRLHKADRILLSTLYSLTETYENYEYVKCIFDYRISNMADVDLTIDQFENSLLRLQESLIKIVGFGSNRRLSMTNPSINDYLNSKIARGSLEYNNIVNGAISVKQLKRLLEEAEFDRMMTDKIKDTSILNFIFVNEKEKNAYIAYLVLKKKIFIPVYKKVICNYLDEFQAIFIYEKGVLRKLDLLRLVFDVDIYNFYLKGYFTTWECLQNVLNQFYSQDLIEAITICYEYFENYHDNFVSMIKEELNENCCVDADDYDFDLWRLIQNNMDETDCNLEIDICQATIELEEWIQEVVSRKISDAINLLPSVFDKEKLFSSIYIDIDGAESVIDSYVESMWGDDDKDEDDDDDDDDDDEYLAIDEIFDR